MILCATSHLLSSWFPRVPQENVLKLQGCLTRKWVFPFVSSSDMICLHSDIIIEIIIIIIQQPFPLIHRFIV